MSKTFFILLGCLVFITGCNQQKNYSLSKTYSIASAGGWDYIAIGPGNDKLYVSHASQVNILDEHSGDSLGVIINTPGVHGIAFINEAGKGYISCGRSNTVKVFSVATNVITYEIPVGENPDAIMFEPFSGKIITCNGKSNNLSVIDPELNKVIATIPVNGKPEKAVSDEAGLLYVNIEDKNEIVKINLANFSVVDHWSLLPGTEPTGLAIDRKTKRLFAGCDKQLVILDAANGKIINTIKIGEGCDGVEFDEKYKLIVSSCGEAGVLSVIKENNADAYTSLPNVTTKISARTLIIDPQTHEIFLPAADLKKKSGNTWPQMIPGTFKILVFAPHV